MDRPPDACMRVAAPAVVARGTLESLPKWLNLIPIVAQWLWLALRHRSITLPSCANPAITSGGLVGEGKMEYFSTMGTIARSRTATTTAVVHTAGCTLPAVRDAMRAAGLDYPVIAKPDMGWCGFGVRLLHGDADLSRYLEEFPEGERIVLQEYLADEGEAGIFYMRDPAASAGFLLGMLLRHYPQVCGDGSSSVARLMARDPRLARIDRVGGVGLCEGVDTSSVPLRGETVRLAVVSSSRVGGLYLDGSWAITPALTAAIDAVARDMRDFHVGRFDVKFTDLAALGRGESFKIIEVNGAGSEAVHAWDPAHSLVHAYRIIFDKQRRMFALAARMRRLGHRPIGLVRLARLHFRQQSLIRRYPPSN
jgi:hypothetical protein